MSDMSRRKWKALAVRLKAAEDCTYCYCGPDSKHDPADLCLHCVLSMARTDIEQELGQVDDRTAIPDPRVRHA